METLPKERFYRVYANLPAGLRDQIVVTMPEVGPMTWKAAYVEVNSETKLGDEIVKKLIELNII